MFSEPHTEPGGHLHRVGALWGRRAGAGCRCLPGLTPETFLRQLSLPRPRTLEVPYAYQCCAYGVCASFFKGSGQWQAEDEEAPKRSLGLLAGRAENHCE